MQMDEYIKRKELQKMFKSVTEDCTCPLHIAAEIDQILDQADAADVVEVVRCRECRHRIEMFRPEVENGGGICGRVYDTGKIEGCLCRVKPDDFCSYGERKEG